MAKIMLVEDDNNLREIYEARLLAEGHEIISAQDGEEALALAVREKPELIISDVMMPKISGFDMLDILRSSPETKNTKVIMMTALSQVEDKDRADRLGADRYLVKSQVTLEDVIRVAREVLDGPESTETNNATEPVAPIGGGNIDMTQPETPAPAEPQAPQPAQDAQPAPEMPLASPPPTDNPLADNQEDVAAAAEQPTASEPAAVDPAPVDAPTPQLPVAETVVAPDMAAPASEPVIPQPMPEPEASVEQPTQPEVAAADISAGIESAQPADEEMSKVEQQIDSFINGGASPAPAEPQAPQPAQDAQPAPDMAAPASEPVAAPPMMPNGFNIDETAAAPAPLDAPVAEQPAAEPVAATDQAAPTGSSRTIQPLGDPTQAPDLNALAAQEADKEAAQQILENVTTPTPEAPTEAPNANQTPDDPNSIAL